MRNNKLVDVISVILVLVGVGIAITVGGWIGMLSVLVGSLSCVLTQLFLSQPRKETTQQEEHSKEFLNVSTYEKNEEPIVIYRELDKMDNKPKFKGGHKTYSYKNDENTK